MQTKLTLRLEDQLIDKAKDYAAQSGKTLSQIVAEYFTMLTSEKSPSPSTSAPVTQSLRGVLRNPNLDEKDDRRHLEEKHR